MPILLTLVFVLSGAAGLIYESIWTRYLGLFVGHGAYAQIIVLTIFLGGMSAGAFVVSRVSEKLRDPLAAYAFVELAIGMIGFVFHDIFVATTNAAYDHLFPSLAGSPQAVIILKWTIAALLILPQSILLGATFPLMSAGVLRIVPRRPGRVLAQLYFANSIGGAGDPVDDRRNGPRRLLRNGPTWVMAVTRAVKRAVGQAVSQTSSIPSDAHVPHAGPSRDVSSSRRPTAEPMRRTSQTGPTVPLCHPY